jgi:hypothetical protein
LGVTLLVGATIMKTQAPDTALAEAIAIEAAEHVFDKQNSSDKFFVLSKHDGPWDRHATIVASYADQTQALVEAHRRKENQPGRCFGVVRFIAEARVTQSPVTIILAEDEPRAAPSPVPIVMPEDAELPAKSQGPVLANHHNGHAR